MINLRTWAYRLENLDVRTLDTYNFYKIKIEVGTLGEYSIFIEKCEAILK